jgi:rare lipoprotein A
MARERSSFLALTFVPRKDSAAMARARATVAPAFVGYGLVASLFVSGCAREAVAPREPEFASAGPVYHSRSTDAGPRTPRSTDPGRRSRAGSGAPSADETQLEAEYGALHPLSVQRGKATYYGKGFVGRNTASGVRYDPGKFTAAHRTLAFGTVVRVVRTDTNGATYVRITDRGPYGDAGRIIDLSVAAASRLSMLRKGVADVRVEVLEYGRKR